MRKDDLHRSLLEALEKKFPKKTELLEVLMEVLFMEKGAVYRRLRGDVPFNFYEVVMITEKLDIPLNNLINPDSVRIDRFELNIVEYMDMKEKDYRQWEEYIPSMSLAKNDLNSEIAESSNVLPISIYSGFESLSKYFLFKHQYLFCETESRIAYGEVIVPERLQQILKSYFIESKNFAKTIYLWDYLIFQYLVTDINFFSGINLISKENVGQIKEDLFALLDYIERIALNGCFEETGNAVSFYISDVNLDGDYSYWQINDTYLCLVRSFLLNAVVSGNESSFRKVKSWIHSLKKSSTLITESGAMYRAEFFDKQRMIVSKL
jgi:hypothetical protein